jgi:hypothetical protein
MAERTLVGDGSGGGAGGRYVLCCLSRCVSTADILTQSSHTAHTLLSTKTLTAARLFAGPVMTKFGGAALWLALTLMGRGGAAVIMPLMAPKASQAYPRPQAAVRHSSVARSCGLHLLAAAHARPHSQFTPTVRGACVCTRCRAATRRRASSARACGAAWTVGSRTSSGLRKAHRYPRISSVVAVQPSRGATARTEAKLHSSSCQNGRPTQVYAHTLRADQASGRLTSAS